MRITQGTFSFLPDLTDQEIEAQIGYALEHGWAVGVEYSDDPHPRNSYWEMWNMPLFDLTPDQVGVAMREVRDCRQAFPEHYVKLTAYDASHTRQTTALAFIVNRPSDEPGFRLDRVDAHDRVMSYKLHAYAAEAPVGGRYGRARSRNGAGGE